jgi:methionine sulfoxide reductase heme-binding subunit
MAKPYAWLNPGVIAGAVIPPVAILARGLTGNLGANPVTAGLNQLGYLTLIWLTATLACTPLKVVLGWTWPIRIRRNLGVIAFCYASLHLLTYLALDLGFDFSQLAEDLGKRPFITVGFLAWLLMAPLAFTSTDASVKRLGFKLWKLLHRASYLCAILAVIHFLWRVKKDKTEPTVFAVVIGLFFAVRIVDALRNRAKKQARA